MKSQEKKNHKSLYKYLQKSQKHLQKIESMLQSGKGRHSKLLLFSFQTSPGKTLKSTRLKSIMIKE